MWNKYHLSYLTTKVIKKNMDSSKNYVFLQSDIIIKECLNFIRRWKNCFY